MSIHTDHLTEWEKSAVISYLVTHASEELRRDLARTMPGVYNRLVNQTVMVTEQRRIDPIRPPTPAPTPRPQGPGTEGNGAPRAD